MLTCNSLIGIVYVMENGKWNNWKNEIPHNLLFYREITENNQY